VCAFAGEHAADHTSTASAPFVISLDATLVTSR